MTSVQLQFHGEARELIELAATWAAEHDLHLSAEVFFPDYVVRELSSLSAIEAFEKLGQVRRVAIGRGEFDLTPTRTHHFVEQNRESLFVTIDWPTKDGLRESAFDGRTDDEDLLRLWRRLIRQAKAAMHKGAVTRGPTGITGSRPAHRHTVGAHKLAEQGVRMLGVAGGTAFIFDDVASRSYDSVLVGLTARVNSLSNRSVVGLFWSCSSALLPEFRAWASRRAQATEPLLQEGLSAAWRFAATGTEPADAARLLRDLEAATPNGDSPDDVSATNAQDAWICADVGIRVLVDSRYDAGSAIEYALEPIVQAATEELFGVSSLGSGDDEAERTVRILSEPRVARAIDFVSWATEFLRERPTPSAEDLEAVRSRAAIELPAEPARRQS